MSDAPRPDDAASPRHAVDPSHAAEPRPTVDELDAKAFDAVVRRAPRFGRFLGTGALVGVLLGVILGFALPNSTTVGRGMVALLMALGFGIIGALTAAVIVVGVDRTPARRVEPTPFPWEAGAPDAAPTDTPNDEERA